MTIRDSTEQPLAFRRAQEPDHTDVQRVAIPAGIDLDAEAWTNRLFDISSSPRVVQALMGLRQLLVPLIGVPPTQGNPFAVREVTDGEALVFADEPHLTFWSSVTQRDRSLEMATAVRLKGWRGRVYWAPVSVLHGPISRAMMRRAIANVPR